MRLKDRELWAKAIVAAMVEEVPMYPAKITEDQFEAQFFYRQWFWELGFRLWI